MFSKYLGLSLEIKYEVKSTLSHSVPYNFVRREKFVDMEYRMKLGVIGLGKLGLPLAALFASNDNEVKAYDASRVLRESIRSGNFSSNEPKLNDILANVDLQLEIVESISQIVNHVDIIFVIVPTPSLSSGHFSNEFVINVVEEIGKVLNQEQKLVIDIVSTVMPGSCDGEIRIAIEKYSRRKIGDDLGLCYNPEFIALGSVIHDMEEPDMHLIGESAPWAGDLVHKALESIVTKTVPSRRMNLIEAELVKIAVNNFVTMKVSYANMLFQASMSLGGIDIDTVTNAIGLDSRIGNKYLKAASPYGGPCFPRDTRALSAFYKDLHISDSLSQATDLINRSHSKFLAEYLSKTLILGQTVGIAGLSYKTGTSVIEESPGLAIAKELSAAGFNIIFWDDEGALPGNLDWPNEYSLAVTLDQLVQVSDFVVISRPLNNPHAMQEILLKNNVEFIDLWRQIIQ